MLFRPLAAAAGTCIETREPGCHCPQRVAAGLAIPAQLAFRTALDARSSFLHCTRHKPATFIPFQCLGGLDQTRRTTVR